MKSRKEIDNECRMLHGNINRMFLTDDLKELDNMSFFAKVRIGEIYLFNYNRLISDRESVK